MDQRCGGVATSFAGVTTGGAANTCFSSNNSDQHHQLQYSSGLRGQNYQGPYDHPELQRRGSVISDQELLPSGAEIRTVPSKTYPSISAALIAPRRIGALAKDVGLVPTLVVRLLPGSYHERLRISSPVVIVGSDGGQLPTIHSVGMDGTTIVGPGACACALRNLKFYAEPGGHALRIFDASPLIENCEVLGVGGEPGRGALCGLDVRGASAKPTVRGCRFAGHGGAAARFGAGSGGTLVDCEVARCGAGVWLEDGADPLMWRNTIAGHRGAGIVVRADGLGRIMGNTVIRNGGGGILVEAGRRVATAIINNRVWANAGPDLRQSPAPVGRTASEIGTFIMDNMVGQQTSDAIPRGLELTAAWPKRDVRDVRELMIALRGAPRDRFAVIELEGSFELHEPLILDRPVVLAGSKYSNGGMAELLGAPGCDAVVVVSAGGEAASLCRVRVSLPCVQLRAGSSCIDVRAGRPTFVECMFEVSGAYGSATISNNGGGILTHAFRLEGMGVSATLGRCAMRGATGAGLLLDHAASATLLNCKISGHLQGGVFLGSGASIVIESSEICKNGHFGVVVAPDARSAYIGRTTISWNAAGSIWHCGGRGEYGESNGHSNRGSTSAPLFVDQCALAGAHGGPRSAPAVVVGPNVDAFLWDASFVQLPDHRGTSLGDDSGRGVVRVDDLARVVVAEVDSSKAWQPYRGAENGRSQGESSLARANGNVDSKAVWIDVTGALPKGYEWPPQAKWQQDSSSRMQSTPDFGRYGSCPDMRHQEKPVTSRRHHSTDESWSTGLQPPPAAQHPSPPWSQPAAGRPQNVSHQFPDVSGDNFDLTRANSPPSGSVAPGFSHWDTTADMPTPQQQQEMPWTAGGSPPGPQEVSFSSASFPIQGQTFVNNTQGQMLGIGTQGDMFGSGVQGDMFGSGTQGQMFGSGSQGQMFGSGNCGNTFGSGTQGQMFGSGTGGEVFGSGTQGQWGPSETPQQFPAVAQPLGGAEVTLPEGLDSHLIWMAAKMEREKKDGVTSAAVAPGGPWGEQDRRVLYQILAMLGSKEKLVKEVIEISGLGGQLRPGDRVYLRGHTGMWFGLRGNAIVCNKADRASAATFIFESKANALRHNCKVTLRVEPLLVDGQDAPSKQLRLCVNPQSFELKAEPKGEGSRDADTQFTLQMDHAESGDIMSGMLIFLKSTGVGHNVDVEGDKVSARTTDRGTLQRIAIEKIPPAHEIPAACPSMDLTDDQKVWVFRRSVQHALADKQALAMYLGGHKPGCKELLQAYTRFWESEWRSEWSMVLQQVQDSSPGSARSRQSSGSEPTGKKSSRNRHKTKDWIFDMFSGVSSDDKTNGDIFVAAIRSFLATALRVSQLEANQVQRVVEEFADSLVADKGFLDCFTPSMLPEKERKAYRSPEEVLFGLTYTTIMLNTDLHNRNVQQKMFDEKKFAGMGKDCGVTSGLMLQIFKNVKKEEL